MRTLDRFELSSVQVKSKRKKSTSNSSGTVMAYPDGGGKEGHHHHQQQSSQRRQQQPHYPQQPQQQSYLSQTQQQQRQQPPDAHQPQHQQNLYSQPQLFGGGQPNYNPRGNPYASTQPQQPPSDITMVAAASMEQEYLQQQAQYLQAQQQYGGAGYPSAARPYGAVLQAPPHASLSYQQQLAMQQAQQPPFGAAAYPTPMDHMSSGGHPPQQMMHQQPQPHPQAAQPYLQPKVGRLPADRPLIKLSVSLIDTYKEINTIYYEEREARRAARAKEKAKQKTAPSGASQGASTAATAPQQGTNNNGWDDEHFDYIVNPGELFYGRYKMKERIGKGSFGQVVRAEDTQENNREVAIKIIKSKKPFLMQAKTEIELLTHLNDKDPEDQHNVVRLITHFMYRNHQCLVFEMLSLNLYELLKNTQFGGVSLNLIRKFAKQVLKSLTFLARRDVDIIHCDLKPENILLRHPKKSGIKVIDFGSSCRSNKRMYSYIQSRFYRSPEVMLGLPYTPSIDMWSLGCILAEMHTGEPLFSGSDQFDQMQKIVKILGMIPFSMLDKANDQHRLQFFERGRRSSGQEEWMIKQQNTTASSSRGGGAGASSSPNADSVVLPSTNPIVTLSEVIQAGSSRKKKFPTSETGNSPQNYDLFVDLIHQMLAFDPRQRIRPDDALNHPFITEQLR